MAESATLEQIVANEIEQVLEETFERVHGIYLDRETSLFETLATVTAEEASRPVSATCSSIAGQVHHVTVYIDLLERYMRGEEPERIDWDATWLVQSVSSEEWAAEIDELRASYRSLRELISTFTDWRGENDVSGALAILVHTAYHLGEIRQALCTVRG